MANQQGMITKVNYEVAGEKIEITAETVRNYLVSGGGNVTNQEVGLFLELCKGQKLNPFLREAYLVKYGNQAATMITGKDAFMKRADSNENYGGIKAGIIVIDIKGNLAEREGTFYMKNKGEELVGGWAKVYFKDNREPLYNSVSIDEYIGRKKDGSVNSMWKDKPATMIKKVATVQALREAFPNTLSQLYTEEEMNIQDELPKDIIDPEEKRREREHVEAPPVPMSKQQKAVLFNAAKEKGLVNGKDVTKLEELAQLNGLTLRSLTAPEGEKLLNIVINYSEPVEEEIQEVEYTEVEEDAPVEETQQSEEDDEEDPF